MKLNNKKILGFTLVCVLAIIVICFFMMDRTKNISSEQIHLNPDIDSLTLSKISTGKKTDKFGIPINELNNIISAMESLNNIKLKGLS